MALEWVQRALERSLGFLPYPATLNLRPNDPDDRRCWEAVRKHSRGIVLAAKDGGFCSAHLFPVAIESTLNGRTENVTGAVLLPDVSGYPEDKIEVVAPIRLKEALGVKDGDQLTLEFLT